MTIQKEIHDYISNNLPEPHNTPKSAEKYINDKIQAHGTLCTAVVAEVEKILFPLKKKYANRFLYRVDTGHKLKSPTGIIEKIIRENKQLGPDEPEYTIENFNCRITDLARFRIVCNFDF